MLINLSNAHLCAELKVDHDNCNLTTGNDKNDENDEKKAKQVVKVILPDCLQNRQDYQNGNSIKQAL